MHNWFPLGLATGEAFCNRVNERKHLAHNLLHGTHTLIASPRRYGKTSLAQQVISEQGWPSTLMEFTLAMDLISSQNILSTGISRLIPQLMPTHKKAFLLATQFFSQWNPKFIIDTHMGAKIELSLKTQSIHLGVMELLQNIDQAAKAAKKRIVLFMDEFQHIATLQEHLMLEAAIRNSAQRMQNTSIIFSGSQRHLLQLMFDDKTRPLYHLCDRINLQRIHETDYENYIQKIAKKRWRHILSSDAMQAILELTACHPYYVNVLCGRLYREEILPTQALVQSIWENYIDEESDRIAKEISQLSPHQKMMLLLLSIYPFSQPTSTDVITKLRISTASAAKCCKILLENDYIYQSPDHFFHLIDPAMHSYLKRQAVILIPNTSTS